MTSLVDDIDSRASRGAGVFYTPKHIVDCVIEETVQTHLKDKDPRQVAGVKIIDPACGDGAFLVPVFEYLLDWHLSKYVQQRKKCAGLDPPIVQTPQGEWALTRAEKGRILKNNIHGVDIDPVAIEKARARLLEAAGTTVSLARNIQPGNSLMESEDFAWFSHFAPVLSNGGFQIVIGNPPWVSLKGRFGSGTLAAPELLELVRKYGGNTAMPNLYELFILKGLEILGPGGSLGFVVPDRLGFNAQLVALRKRLLKSTQLQTLLYKAPFPKVTADTLIFNLKNTPNVDPDHEVRVGTWDKPPLHIRQSTFRRDPEHRFVYFENAEIQDLVSKLESLPNTDKLKKHCQSASGFGGRSKLLTQAKVKSGQIKALKGQHIGRYKQLGHAWFSFESENLTGRTKDTAKLGARPKILLRKTGREPVATLDDSDAFPEQSLYFLFNKRTHLDYKYLLGILNSQLIAFYVGHRLLTNKHSIPQLKKKDLDAIPIRRIDRDKTEELTMHHQLTKLVDKMLKYNTRRGAETDSQLMAAWNKQIDGLVYRLYSLTPDEIDLVEHHR